MTETQMTLEVGESGTIRSIYKDELRSTFESIGEMHVSRASNVEWEENRDDFSGRLIEAGWTVRAAHDERLALRWVGLPGRQHIGVLGVGSLVYFQGREEALREEVKHFWKLLPPNTTESKKG